MNLPDVVATAPASLSALVELREDALGAELRVTYGELADRVARTAAGLFAGSVGVGDRVAIAAPSGIDFVVAYLAVQAVGAAAVLVNHRSPGPEFATRLDLAATDLVVLGDYDVPLPAGLTPLRVAGSQAQQGVSLLDSPPVGLAPVPGGSPAAILFTSGVSGSPRPVILTHDNLTAVQLGLVSQIDSRLGPSTVALAVLPLAHVFGLNSSLGTMLRAGGSIVLLDRFDAANSLKAIARYGVTAVSAVPQMWAMWAALAEGGGASGNEFATVLRASASAAHLPPSTAVTVREGFGVAIAAGYGLTETSGTIALEDLAAPSALTVGRPLGEAQLRLVDGDGQVVEEGDRGEIWIGGPSVFAGYVGHEPLSKSMLAPGGWCRTGDVGVLDDEGRLSIVDRIKDVVIVGGFNVAPTEVEDVLVAHPRVGSALVVGEPDARTGERVVAFVVAKAGGAPPDPGDVTEYCRRRLARYKVPSRIEVRRELPTTEGGKAVRRLLRSVPD